MATTTTRMALRKPAGTDDVDVTLDLGNNYDKLDAGAGAVTCTSSARPSSPFNGMLARESDTLRVIRYNGSTWDAVGGDHVHLRQAPQTLTYAATVTTNVSLGNYFRVTLTGNMTLAAPTNPLDAQWVSWEFLASGAARTVTLATGTAGSFQFGTNVTGLTATTSGKRDIIRAVYNASLDRWLVLAADKGF